MSTEEELLEAEHVVQEGAEYAEPDIQAILEEYQRKQMLEHMIAPSISFVLHIVVLVALAFMVQTEVTKSVPPVEVEITELETTEIPEPIQEVDEIEEEVTDIVPEMDMPPAPEMTAESEEMQTMMDDVPAAESQDSDMAEIVNLAMTQSPLRMSVPNMLGGRGNHKSSGAPVHTHKYVDRGLAWLADQQQDNGSWPNKAHINAVQAAALLAFLGRGHSTVEGKYKDVVRKGINNFLGRIPGDGGLGNHGHATPFVVMAICDAFAMAPEDKKLAAGAEKMVQYVLNTQHPHGGWSGGAAPNPKNSTEIDVPQTIWFVMALFSARLGGMDVDEAAFTNAKRALLAVANDTFRGKVVFTNHGGRTTSFNREYAMKSMLFTGLTFLGVRPEEPVMQRLAKHIVNNMPPANNRNNWLVYNQGMGLFQMGAQSPEWNTFQTDALKHLVKSAQKDPKDSTQIYWTTTGFGGGKAENGESIGHWGDVGSTAMAILNLEVWYRYGSVHDMYKKYGRIVPAKNMGGGSGSITKASGKSTGSLEDVLGADTGLVIE